ncbi:glycerate kinase [Arsenophonus endosymbiont of Aleurodicus floccissimus]|uniref:glycerate kinase n=1 Tax=Arsenophonus endosymbiont of Aleurodicus floccissimus TaxID=2152761 RepID=UPI0034E1DB23
MKIIIAPDSFKESLTAKQAEHAIEAGFMAVFPAAEYLCFAMADGGEGTVDALIDAEVGERIELTRNMAVENTSESLLWLAE